MKAAIYYGPGDIRIEEIRRPQTSSIGAIIKVKACGVCPILDLDDWIRFPAGATYIGRARGHEWSGEIVEVGSQVSGFKVGDRVGGTEPLFRPCFRCDFCQHGDYWRCSNMGQGMSINGAFAEYLELHFVTDDSLMAFPDNVSFRDLAMLEPLSVGLGLAKKVRTRDKVVAVLGQDLVGLGAVAFLKKKGVPKVISCDVSQLRLKASKEVGSDIVIDSLKEDVVKVIMNETLGEGVDVAFVIDARPITLFQAMSSVRRAGSVWQACHYRGPLQLSPSIGPRSRYAVGAEYNGEIEPALAFDPSFLYMRAAFGNLGPRIPRWIEVIDLIKSGLITAEKYVTHVFPLEKTKEAFEKAMNPHETIRVMVEM